MWGLSVRGHVGNVIRLSLGYWPLPCPHAGFGSFQYWGKTLAGRGFFYSFGKAVASALKLRQRYCQVQNELAELGETSVASYVSELMFLFSSHPFSFAIQQWLILTCKLLVSLRPAFKLGRDELSGWVAVVWTCLTAAVIRELTQSVWLDQDSRRKSVSSSIQCFIDYLGN